jgi:hypothetical protein
MLKKSAIGVLATLPCSRTGNTLRASMWLRPCWTEFFEHPREVLMSVFSHALMCDALEIFYPFISDDKGSSLGTREPLLDLFQLVVGLTDGPFKSFGPSVEA